MRDMREIKVGQVWQQTLAEVRVYVVVELGVCKQGYKQMTLFDLERGTLRHVNTEVITNWAWYSWKPFDP